MEVRVTRAALGTMLGESGLAVPNECCGILLGRDRAIDEARPTPNVAADPRRHFEIDPQALVDAYRLGRSGGPKVIGYYHSHPAGPARPSETDQAMAAGDGSVWAIVGQTAVTFWRDGQEGFEPLSYTVEDR
jgi:proteasome lid subunit RPN8/RPN11